MKTCKNCGKELNNVQNVYCGHSCNAKYNNKKLLAARVRKTYPEVLCKFCGKLIQRRGNTFCDSSCSGKFHSPGRKLSQAHKDKLSAFMKKLIRENPEALPKFKGGKKKILHSKECRVCKNQFVPKYSNKINCSRECLKIDQAIRNSVKRCSGWANFGKYKGIECDSTWELAFVIWALDSGEEIKRCKLRIPYNWENKTRYYTPDFEIGDSIIEIKGHVDKNTTEKLKAAKEQNIEIILIGKKQIFKYIDYAKEKYGKDPTKHYSYFYSIKN